VLPNTYVNLKYNKFHNLINKVISIQGLPGVKVNTLGFNSRADAESKMSYTHGSSSQRFRSYEFLKYNK